MDTFLLSYIPYVAPLLTPCHAVTSHITPKSLKKVFGTSPPPSMFNITSLHFVNHVCFEHVVSCSSPPVFFPNVGVASRSPPSLFRNIWDLTYIYEYILPSCCRCFWKDACFHHDLRIFLCLIHMRYILLSLLCHTATALNSNLEQPPCWSSLTYQAHNSILLSCILPPVLSVSCLTVTLRVNLTSVWI